MRPYYPHPEHTFNPAPHHWHYMFVRRPPRRFFWFFIGGLAATAFWKMKEKKGSIEYDATITRNGTTWRRHSGDPNQPSSAEKWEERGHLQENTMGKVADMSVAALDAVIANAEAMKRRLAEHRGPPVDPIIEDQVEKRDV